MSDLDELDRKLVKRLGGIDRAIESLRFQRELIRKMRRRIERTKKKVAALNGEVQDWMLQEEPTIDPKQLQPLIEAWCELYELEHDTGGNIILAERSGVNSKKIGLLRKGEWPGRLNLDETDRILEAIDAPWLIHELVEKSNGHPVIPDPPESQYYED